MPIIAWIRSEIVRHLSSATPNSVITVSMSDRAVVTTPEAIAGTMRERVPRA
jgi:hypothetical protein